MPNPIFQVLGGGNSQSNMMQQFQQFMNQMKGKDPNAKKELQYIIERNSNEEFLRAMITRAKILEKLIC